MMPPKNVIDITVVASLSVSGPNGNAVSDFWSSKKLAEVQPSVDPYDAVNKCPENIFSGYWNYYYSQRKIFSYRKELRKIVV